MVPQAMKLLDMLSNHDVTYYVPPYQRNYEWTDEQCGIFFDDIIKTHDQNVEGHISEHFFGSITFFQTETSAWQPNRLVLIDGQQRITTTMLFLAALRDTVSDERMKEFIDSTYLKNNGVNGNSDESKIKLKQVESDWNVYKHIILHEEIPAEERTAAVYRNYRFFMNLLLNYQNAGKDLISLFDKGLKKFSVISIELQPAQNKWENPQEIFESMNSLGKPLSLADLVRNYLLLGLDSNTQEELYKKYWLHIEKTIPGQVSNYIRDFMQWHSKSSYKKASEANYKELYRKFKDIFAGLESRTILQKLSQCADVYAWILPGGRTKIEAVDYELKDLQYLKITTAYSFLLALMSAWKEGEFSDSEIADILDVFRIYIIRRRLLGLTQEENKVFPLYVNYLDQLEKASNKREAMLSVLVQQDNKMRLPNDVELTRYLENANFYNFQYSRFILSLIEEKLTKNRPEDKKIQIEHIMPQTLTDEWKAELGKDWMDVHQELVNTIGNLTLIRHNQELGNKGFAEKKQVYDNNSGLQIARKAIIDQDRWDKKAIQHRAKWIISFLLEKVLTIPEEMRRTNNFTIKETHGLSFLELQLYDEIIHFIPDPTYAAKVVSDKEVEFEGKRWKLSPLTRELFKRMGKVSKSGAYQGSQYWEYEGMKLASII